MEERRHHVMQVAQQLFLDKGFAQTSIQDIIKQSGISKGTFYNYFASKNECLIAILKYAQKEAFERRKQLLRTNRRDDQTIFAKQIVIRMQVNKEQNLLPLLGFVFHSKDQELREFAKSYHLYEVAWLAERFIDLYGSDLYKTSIDCAVFLLGLTQQYNLVWSFYVEEEVNAERLIHFILRKMAVIANHFLDEKNSFIHDDLFRKVEGIWYKTKKNPVLHSLERFKETHAQNDDVALEYVDFLIEELMKENKRIYLITSIIDSLYTKYQHSELEDQVFILKKQITKEIT